MATDRFHDGERAIQDRFGTGPWLAARERDFFSQSRLTGNVAAFVASLPLVAVATRDVDGWPFPSLEHGPWEIVGVERVRLHGVRDAERLSRHLDRHPKAGTLAIDLQRRFRIRINGRAQVVGDVLDLRIEHAFGNCRKYLHTLQRGAPAAGRPAVGPWRTSLDRADAVELALATHVFIATQDADGDLDAQYKGGLPGWLDVRDERTLVWPDYPGNGMFMSLGNLQQDPRIGVLIPPGLLLQGTAEIVDEPAAVTRFPGAERVVRVRVERVARARELVPETQEVASFSATFADLGIGEAVGPIA